MSAMEFVDGRTEPVGETALAGDAGDCGLNGTWLNHQVFGSAGPDVGGCAIEMLDGSVLYKAH